MRFKYSSAVIVSKTTQVPPLRVCLLNELTSNPEASDTRCEISYQMKVKSRAQTYVIICMMFDGLAYSRTCRARGQA
jgi:hypothetical protein